MAEVNKVEILTPEQLFNMFDRQEELNIKYSGDDWRNRLTLTQIKCAILDEVSEFLREIESDWKWWKKDANYNKQKALFELIDIIHFSMMAMQFVGVKLDQNLEQLYLYKDKSGEPLDRFVKSVNRFISSLENSNYYIMDDLMTIISSGSDILGLRNGDIYTAYVMKNDRNHERIAGGILTGHYDKAKEAELKL